MTVSSADRTVFLTMVARRITAPRVYMEHRSLSNNLGNFFDEDGVRDWKPIGKKKGYDVAEFTKTIDGYESRCIAVQRYTNAAHTGYKRMVIGMGCSVSERDTVYRIFDQISAPGD